MLEPERDEALPVGKRALDARGEGGRILGIGAQRGVAGRLVERGVRRDYDRDAARHRLDHRDAEALEARRVRDDGRATIETRELGVGDIAEPPDPRPVEERLLAPALGSDDGELEVAAEQALRLDEDLEVLARLERRDREDVRRAEIGGRPVGAIDVLRRRVRDVDPLTRDRRASAPRRRPCRPS